MLDSYGRCGKAATPQAMPRRLRFRPMESEHTVVEMNIIQLPFFVLDSYGRCGKAATPQAMPRRLRFRPMESEHTVVEMNIIQLPLRKFGHYLTRLFFNSLKKKIYDYSKSSFYLNIQTIPKELNDLFSHFFN